MNILKLFLLSPCALFALYSGNPSTPAMPEEGRFFAKESLLGFTLGYEGDYVYDFKMERNLKPFSGIINLATFSTILNEVFAVYGGLGSANFKVKNHTQTFYSGTGLAAQGGMRGIVFSHGTLDWGVDAKFLYAAPFSLRVGQLSTALAYHGETLIPYAGVKYMHSQARVHGRSTKNNAPIGCFVGFGLDPSRAFALNVEISMWNEQALALCGWFRF